MEETPNAVMAITEEQPENLLDLLAAKRKVVSENREVFIPVPGYDKEPPVLLVKYRLLSGEEINGIAVKVRQEFKNSFERNMMAGVDTFIHACSGIYVDLGDGKPQPLTVGGKPVTGFTRALAEGMQFDDKLADPDSPREVVYGLFANNDVALASHNYALNLWMSDTSTDVTREMFGGGNL